MTETRTAAACRMVLAAAILMFSVPDVGAQGGPTRVGVATVDKVQIADTRPVIGQLVAAVEAKIATRTAGIVDAVAVEIGEVVAKDQVIATLDRGQLDLERSTAVAEVEVAKAGLTVAEAEAKRAQLGFERQAALRSSGAFSRSRFEDLEQDAARARGALGRARAQLQQAQAKLAEVDYRLRHAEIRAPFHGVVIARQAQPGAYTPVGSQVVTLLDTDRLEIEADVPVELIAGLAPGVQIPAVFSDNSKLKATVRAVVPVQDVSTRTRPVRFSLDLANLERSLLARGKSVTLQVPASAPRSALAVPKDALVQNGTGWMVYAVVEGQAQPRPVDLGQPVAERIEITRGLSEGDVVVVRGNERLRPGQKVAPGTPEGGRS